MSSEELNDDLRACRGCSGASTVFIHDPASQFHRGFFQCFLSLCRFGAELTYYGISLNIAEFGLNLYLTQFIFASMELPMKISVYFFLNKVGRKPSEVGALFLTGVFLTINMFVPKGLVSINSILYFKVMLLMLFKRFIKQKSFF